MIHLDKITKLGRYFLAVPMVVFGIQHFLYAEFVVHLVPTWIPGRLFWTYFAGVALFAAGVGITTNILPRLAATLLGLMISIWVIILHIPRVFEFPGDSEFINIFDALLMSSGAFLLSSSLPGKIPLEKISVWGAMVSPFLIAVAMIVFGVEQFIHGKLVFIVGAPHYAIPGEKFLVYLTTTIFMAAAMGIIFSKKTGAVAALLGVYIFLITVAFYAPQLVNDIYHAHTWTTFLKGMAMSGSALILSSVTLKKEKAITFRESIQA